MKRIILSFAFLLAITMCWAQTKATGKKVEIAPGSTVIKKVYEMKDEGVVVPKYPGGLKALMSFLSTNIKYPEEAEVKGLEGKVLCAFVVAEDGSVSDVEIQRGVDLLLDNEAIRVVNMMPKWTPGTKDGFPIRVRYILPVSFRLNKKTPNADSIRQVRRQALAAKQKYDDENTVMPTFPGGSAALMQYLSKNVRYPETAKVSKTEGRVVCSYIVEKDGSISNVKVVKSVSPDLDAEAVRVVKAMPKWNPGSRDNQNISVKYTLPITFKL